MANDMRTPLHRVLGLGSSHEGTMHFWRQRVTGLANIPLTIAFVIVTTFLSWKVMPRTVTNTGIPS